MKAYISQIHYCVPLTKEQWAELNRLNAQSEDRSEEVILRLKKAKAENVEYNGHFGRNIFFSIEKAGHLSRVIKEIEKITTPQNDRK